MFGFGRKTEREPEYVNSPLNTPMINYKTYSMGKVERLLVTLVVFVLGGLVGLVFYEGLFKVDGYYTVATYISNVFFFTLMGVVAAVVFIPVYKKNRIEKRNAELRMQFRDLLEALVSSFSTGSNVSNAFNAALDDLRRQYKEDDYIVLELEEIVGASHQGFGIDAMLKDFATRSGDEDISSFADVFAVCYRQGGSMTAIIHQTRDVLGEKMAVSDEIRTKLTSNKMQLNVMSLMPVGVIILMRLLNQAIAQGFATPQGVIVNTVAIALFLGAYLFGQRIVEVRV